MKSQEIIFITGTDTGVGKTLLTALLLGHLRGGGVDALAMKPFCSGGLDDVKLLQSLQPGAISDAEMNPYYFKKPVAPLVAMTKKARKIELSEVIDRISAVKKRCEVLLVEGSGGLLVPLGADYTVADLIRGLKCKVIVASRNKLGTINHTLLTVSELKRIGIVDRDIKVVLMKRRESDVSCETNRRVLEELLKPTQVYEVPFFGAGEIGRKKVILESAKLKNLLQKVTFEK
jgi:dethiobiotin synthetase